MVFVIHWHESAMDLQVFPIPIPSPTSLSTWFLWVFPVHQAPALVLCIQPGLVICFTLDNIHCFLRRLHKLCRCQEKNCKGKYCFRWTLGSDPIIGESACAGFSLLTPLSAYYKARETFLKRLYQPLHCKDFCSLMCITYALLQGDTSELITVSDQQQLNLRAFQK